MSEQVKQPVPFRMVSCALFKCPRCKRTIYAQHDSPFHKGSGGPCLCGASYSIAWGETDEQTTIEMDAPEGTETTWFAHEGDHYP